MKRHLLTETNYCAVMYEQPYHREGLLAGRPACTAAGRYMDTEGRVICARCARDLVVAKLTSLPKLIEISARLVDLPEMPDELRTQLRTLVTHGPGASPC